MSKFIRQSVNKFIRASDFNIVEGEEFPPVYTPYFNVDPLENGVNRWKPDLFVGQPKVFLLGMFGGADTTAGQLAAMNALTSVPRPKNTFIVNGATKTISGSGFTVENSGSVFSYTGNPSFETDTPANLISVPNFVSADPNAEVINRFEQFYGFDILYTIIYHQEEDAIPLYDNTTIRNLAEERITQYISNLPKFQRIRYRFCFSGVDSDIVTFYTTLFGEAEGISVIPFFLTNPLNASVVETEIRQYVEIESEAFFADKI